IQAMDLEPKTIADLIRRKYAAPQGSAERAFIKRVLAGLRGPDLASAPQLYSRGECRIFRTARSAAGTRPAGLEVVPRVCVPILSAGRAARTTVHRPPRPDAR